MQEQATARQGGATFIWKWGALYGVILSLVQIVLSLSPLGSFKTILNLLVWLIGFFVIGLFASRHTGRVGTGALVGLITGLVSGLIVVLFGIMQITANGPQFTQALNQAAHTAQQHGQSISPSALRAIATVGIVIGLIVTVVVQLGLEAGIGALGGLVGRSLVKNGRKE